MAARGRAYTVVRAAGCLQADQDTCRGLHVRWSDHAFQEFTVAKPAVAFTCIPRKGSSGQRQQPQQKAKLKSKAKQSTRHPSPPTHPESSAPAPYPPKTALLIPFRWPRALQRILNVSTSRVHCIEGAMIEQDPGTGPGNGILNAIAYQL